MAIIEYDPLADKIQGVRSGTIFSQSRSGYFVRSRTCPTQSRTPRRSRRHVLLSPCAHRWFNTLSDPQRAAWVALGAATTWENPFGVEYHPSGFNLFIRTNALRLFYGLAFIDTAPGLAVCAAYGKVPFWNHETQQLYLSGGSATPSNYQTFIDVSPVIRNDIEYYSGPFLWNTNASGAALKSDLALGSPGQYSASDRLAIRCRDMAADGSLSAPEISVFEVEPMSHFLLQSQLTGHTFTNGSKAANLFSGDVQFTQSNPTTGAASILPLKCRLRHVAVCCKTGARVISPPILEVYIKKAGANYYNFNITDSLQSNKWCYQTQKKLTGYPFDIDDGFSVVLWCNCDPGDELPVSNVLIDYYFQEGEFE